MLAILPKSCAWDRLDLLCLRLDAPSVNGYLRRYLTGSVFFASLNWS